ncbi:Anti-sigma-K factor RskA [Amycolatopsis marina]|uniref:Regulator of SigK n=1 Tax=Amycolatopsis marina TaxID=490629 RepID=A0A1I1AKH0_9PSEU|nr:anti-sigma factor [Amycolatopsis marina]SFB38437.1 Anti-sigma-K factor RskA [Amycolatopsis marina]
MTSPEMHTLAGAFAVDALDEHERARFQRHLNECDSCRQEVRELRATAAKLGLAVAEDPPPELKQRVLAEVRGTRQQPPGSGQDPGERSRRSAGVPRWMMGVAAAAAVVGLALAGVFAGMTLSTQNELTAAQQQLEQARERYEPVADLLTAPDLRTVHNSSSIGGAGIVLASKSLDRMMFMASDLPEPPEGHDYELWRIDGSETPRSAAVFGQGSTPPIVSDGVGSTALMAVTVEPDGGSPTGAPTTSPILVLPLSA